MSAMPAQALRAASLDDLVADVLEIVRTEGEPIRIAVPRVLAAARPDAEAEAELLRVGLQTIVNYRINSGWTPEDETADENVEIGKLAGRRVTGSPRKNRIEVGLKLIESRNYEGADGRRKVLSDFTLADCVSLAELADSRQRGYAMLAKFAKAAASFMRTREVKRLGDLPEDDRKKCGLYLAAAPEVK